MTISLKVSLMGKDGKPIVGQDGTVLTKAASVSVRKVTLTVNGKEIELPSMPVRIAELIGEAVYERPFAKDVVHNARLTRQAISKLPAEAVVNVYHSGYNATEFKVLTSAEKTHSIKVSDLRTRLDAAEGKTVKSLPEPVLHGFWKDYPHGRRGRGKQNLEGFVWEL